MQLDLAEVAAFLGVPLEGLEPAAREVFGLFRCVDDISLMDVCVGMLCDVFYYLSKERPRWYFYDDGWICDAEFFELRARPRPIPSPVGVLPWLAELYVQMPSGLVLVFSCFVPDKASAQAVALLVARDVFMVSFPSFFAAKD